MLIFNLGLTLLFCLFGFFLFAVPGIECRGVLPLRYTPGPIFFYALFLKPGLTKLWRASLGRERQRERETERERQRERREIDRLINRSIVRVRVRACALRLAANPDPPVSASQSTGITSVRHHARLFISYF